MAAVNASKNFFGSHLCKFEVITLTLVLGNIIICEIKHCDCSSLTQLVKLYFVGINFLRISHGMLRLSLFSLNCSVVHGCSLFQKCTTVSFVFVFVLKNFFVKLKRRC